MYEFTEDELASIEVAKATGDHNLAWDHKLIAPVKKRFKKVTLKAQDSDCCYCFRDHTEEFPMVLDIEHILPKGRPNFFKFIFTPENLAVACKKCNMNVKGVKINFLTLDAGDITESNWNDSANYLFVHPHFDEAGEHIELNVNRKGQKYKFIYYEVINHSEKGTFHYDYFRLKEREVAVINDHQNIRNNIGDETFELLRSKFDELQGC